VVALNSAGGKSAQSNTVTATTSAALALPGAATALGGSKTNQNILFARANLSWTAPTTGGAPTSYRVERCAGATCTNFTLAGTSTTTTFTQNNVLRGITYRYRVVGVNASGTGTVFSNIFNIAM
jgi:hypothetical protein